MVHLIVLFLMLVLGCFYVKACSEGYWGPFCVLRCDDTCDACHSKTGDCLRCRHGSYGTGLCQKCPFNCDGSCHQNTGKCYSCAEGFYGFQCQQHCGQCVSGACALADGTCGEECLFGYYGATCRDECPPGCRGGGCSRETGRCVFGCQSGYYGDRCDMECHDGPGCEVPSEVQDPSLVTMRSLLRGWFSSLGVFALLTLAAVSVQILARRRSKLAEAGPRLMQTEAGVEQSLDPARQDICDIGDKDCDRAESMHWLSQRTRTDIRVDERTSDRYLFCIQH